MPKRITYSQYKEDQWILENLTLPERGIFVDVGAFDGLHLSNTKRFEEMGWTGICVEADPRRFPALIKNRTCVCVQAAVGMLEGDRKFHLMPWGWSGLARKGGETVTVPGKKLSTILNEYRIFGIDLLSIDTEGTELGVWQSLDYARRPKILIIEHTTVGLPKNQRNIMRQMDRDGYTLRHKTLGNFIFTKGK